MNREQIRTIAWLAMNNFTELAGLTGAVSNREFHAHSACTDDDWPTLDCKGLIVDMLPGNDNEILIQALDPDTGEYHEELCCSPSKVDLFFLTFNSLRCIKKLTD